MPATSATNPMLVILGLLSAGIIAAALTGTRLPLIDSDRAALVALLIVGMAMCSFGMQTVTYGWLNPFNVAGVLLGVLGLGLAVAVLAGLRVPFITGYREAIIALAGLMAVKVVLAVTRGILA